MSLLTRRRLILASKIGTKPILPIEFQRCEWVGSNGTQYIKTGVLSNDNNEFYAEFQITSAAAANNNSLRNYVFSGASEESRNQFCYARTKFYGWGERYNITRSAASTQKIVATADKSKFTLNGETDYTPTSHTFPTPTEVYLFANNNGTDTAGSFSLGLMIYALKISRSGEELRDFVPCYRKDDGVIGMYDTVSKTFFTNAGSGTFLKGADVN